MPRAVQYKANSIVYFQGDVAERIYILKSGKVSLNYNDIETGQELHELIQTGEFFGVKSALGRYTREETAVVLSDAQMVVFTVPEFEQLIMQNTRIIMKMLKVFSNQLRRIHKQVRNLISSGKESADPESGLFRIGQYYHRTKKFPQALYAYRRYLTYYPSGKYADEANRNIPLAEQNAQGSTRSSVPVSAAAPAREELSNAAKAYYNAVSLHSQEKYQEALKEFQHIASDKGDQEYAAKAAFEIGRCYFALGRYDECIRHLSGMIKTYPKHPDLTDALFYVGNCYEKKDDFPKALGFYKKILTMVREDMPIHRKVKKAIAAMGDAS
ncbi:cyclic nucleotide-binding domain-containing protein [Sediminispirochaeta smaragdinae]|uniref:Transcriptional regulator, Crp/Fnr family n=1 Tax=Sediminispirochaeta smaragdinae (strain DSM 11293 / JCM 15392 / SEBR 4228) TaxID=573413 RepID=E1R698_SEDSS|nr:cyclic nucleotide-binding domain-containing protein [Sediminispirochaeta smaragdinae]ADK80863.1 putative transcriptional regulator, Crp/Fnr family [Sediminispirochaeta smaragdinae DSM 11293]